jgi:uncharacterized protein YkwD
MEGKKMSKMNKTKVFFQCLMCLVVVFAMIPAVPTFAGAPSYYPGYPQGEIGVSTPEIGIHILSNGTKLVSKVMYIDKVRVDVVHDEANNKFYYQPTEPLSPGEHEAKITIGYEGYQLIVQVWKFTVSDSAIQSFPEADATQLTALQAINDYRVVMGLNRLTINDRLNLAATSHSKYLAVNNEFSHYQVKGKQGFTGVDVGDRAQYHGYSQVVYEDISLQQDWSPIAAADGLFDAPYHRIPFMDPASKEFGYGRAAGMENREKYYYHAMNFGIGGYGADEFVIYPAANETDVPRLWYGHEIPDPLRLHSNAKFPVGYPIMAGIYGANIEKVELVTAKLTKTNDGTEVPVFLNSVNGNPKDEYLSQEVIIIPKSPLAFNQSYTVDLQLKATNWSGKQTPYNKKWSFTTESKDGLGKERLHADINETVNKNDTPTGTPSETPVGIPASTSHKIVFTIDHKGVNNNGQTSALDVAPMIVNGSTYLPFRALGEALKANVSWVEDQRAAIFEKNETRIVLFPGENLVFVNGSSRVLDNGALIVSNRTMVPVRFVSEVLGAEVKWNSEQRTVTVSY